MKKQILTIGKALSKAEQRSINGGTNDGLCILYLNTCRTDKGKKCCYGACHAVNSNLPIGACAERPPIIM